MYQTYLFMDSIAPTVKLNEEVWVVAPYEEEIVVTRFALSAVIWD